MAQMKGSHAVPVLWLHARRTDAVPSPESYGWACVGRHLGLTTAWDVSRETSLPGLEELAQARKEDHGCGNCGPNMN